MPAPLEPELAAVRGRVIAWQTERLHRMHADLRAHPRTRPAVEFFLTEVYAPRDFRQRDADLERVSSVLSHVLPKGALDYLGRVLELNVITEELDTEIARIFYEDDDLDAENILSATWIEAVRRSENEAGRRHQVVLMRDGGKHLDRIAFRPAVDFTLRMARRPAEIAGLGELYHVMYNGFQAFPSSEGSGDILEHPCHP